MPEKLLDFRTKKLLISHVLFRAGNLISQIFLNIYLFKATNDIKMIALFNVILLIFQFAGFAGFAKTAKFGYRNLITSIALGGLSLMSLGVIILGEAVASYYIAFAMGIGFFTGMYWIVYNNSEFDVTTTANRGNYQGLKRMYRALFAIIFPALVGFIIGINLFGYGYEIAFGIGIVLFLVSAVLSFVPIKYVSEQKFSMKNAVKQLDGYSDLKKIVGNSVFLGFSMSSPLVETIIPLLLFVYGIKEMDLGFWVSFFTTITVVVSYLFGKFVPYRQYKNVYALAGLFYVTSIVILVFFPSYWYMIIFSSIMSLLFTLIGIPQTVFFANIFQKHPGYKEVKSEFMVMREFCLTLGRVLAFSCIFLIGSFNASGVNTLFGIMGIVMLLSVLLFTSLSFEGPGLYKNMSADEARVYTEKGVILGRLLYFFDKKILPLMRR